MTQYLSSKIKILSFLLIIFVLYIHSGFHADEISGMKVNNFVQDFISGQLNRFTVPLFFMISGYLFFLNTENGIKVILWKINKRIKSLLFPYFYGCIYFVVFLFIIQHIPGFSSYMNGNILSLFYQSFPVIIKNIFWSVENGNAPLAFQLWFLRDLIIIVVVFTPFQYYFLRLFKWWSIPLLYALTFVSIIPFSLLNSIFWYSFGGIFAFTKTSLEFKETKWAYLIYILFIFTLFLQDFQDFSCIVNFQIPIALIDIAAFWLIYDRIISSDFVFENNKWISISCGLTFFYLPIS